MYKHKKDYDRSHSPFPLKIPTENLDLIPIKGLGILGKHCHAVNDIVVAVFAGDGVGGELVHHSAVVLFFLVQGLVLEEAMLLYPRGIEDDFRFLIARCKLGGNLRDATISFYRFLNVLGDSATGVVMLKAGHLDLILNEAID